MKDPFEEIERLLDDEEHFEEVFNRIYEANKELMEALAKR